MKATMHNSKVLFFFMCLFLIQSNSCSEVKNATSQLEQTIDSIIIQYQESLKEIIKTINQLESAEILPQKTYKNLVKIEAKL